jgi:ketosteroid isomerase-like protein
MRPSDDTATRVSSDNVEIVKRGYEAFNRDGPKGIFRFLHPDIQWHTPDEDVQRDEPYRGHDGVREFWRLWDEEMTEIEIEPEEYIDGGDCVLVMVTTRSRGRTSGAPIEIRDAHLWTHAPDGLALSLRMFLDRDRALAAAGVER